MLESVKAIVTNASHKYQRLAQSENVAVAGRSSGKRSLTLVFLIITSFYLVFALFKASAQKNLIVTEEIVIGQEETLDFKLQHCDCVRKLPLSIIDESSEYPAFNTTTCSHDAFKRGKGQKIAGFSFYGDVNSDYSKKKGYFEGIVGNLEIMPHFYPGWVMRLYFDLSKDDPVMKDLCDLACSNINIDLCDARDLPGTPMKDASKMFPMDWRFFPTLDPQVDLYLSRDLDSRFNDREIAAVNEWLDSDKDFHFMRDHPDQGTFILGSAWGTRLVRDSVREGWKNSWKKGMQDTLLWAKRNDYGPDQGFLAKHVWPWAKRLSLGHDSYLCHKYPYTRGFPTQRKKEPNNFMASVVNENNTLWKICPVKCRPATHKDWLHC